MGQPLQANTQAPEFSLPSTPDQKVSLSDLHGAPVVLIFYPADWSPVCTDELAIFNQGCPRAGTDSPARRFAESHERSSQHPQAH